MNVQNLHFNPFQLKFNTNNIDFHIIGASEAKAVKKLEDFKSHLTLVLYNHAQNDSLRRVSNHYLRKETISKNESAIA